MSFNFLVVDDSAVMRRMVIRTLGMTGVPIGEIHEASHGKEALSVLAHAWIDVALVDINMPVMDGEKFINAVREDPKWRSLSVIVVSTESSETRIERIVAKGAEFVHKPFTAETLRRTILTVTGVPDEGPATVSSGSDGELDF